MKLVEKSPAPRVMAGLPVYGGMMHAGFVRSLMQLDRSGFLSRISWMEGESLVPRARNTIAMNFLESDCDYLLFLDCDLVFEPNAIARLLSHRKQLISGIYPHKTLDLSWVVDASPAENRQAMEPVRVDHCATGCMLAHRSVFETLREHLGQEISYVSDTSQSGRREYDFFRCGVVNDRYLSEDYYFCHQWRQVGGEVWVDPEVQCEHIGQIVYPPSSRALESALQTHIANGYQPETFAARPENP